MGWRALSDKAAAEIYDMKGLWVKKKKDPQQMLSVTAQNNSNQELESDPFFISSITARISDPARWQDTKALSSRACKSLLDVLFGSVNQRQKGQVKVLQQVL